MKIAEIECPHCGGRIKIRKIEAVDLPPDIPPVRGTFRKVIDDLIDELRDQIDDLRALHPAPGNAGEAFGWFEPITPTFGGSLVERFAKGPDKPRHFSDFAFRLYAAPASNPQEGGAVSRRASEGDPK